MIKLSEDYCKRCRAFPERVGTRILSLERVDYFGTSEYCRGRKTEECYTSKTSMVRLLNVSKAVKGYCVTWLACIFFFAFPTWSLWLPPPDTGSLRINCLLISYLISKQGRVNAFRASYFLSNLQANVT